MAIEPIQHRRVYRQIADQIAGLIRGGEFALGSRLPAERDLARALGVSRPSVREAMIALEVAGLVEIRMGSGIYVARLPTAAELADYVGPFELIAARRVVEGETAAIAAAHVTPADLTELRTALDAMRAETADDFGSEANDRRFHLGIAAATRNGAFPGVVELLWRREDNPMWGKLRERLHAREARPMWVEDHERIVAALAAHDPGAARAAMHRHLDRVSEMLMRASTSNPEDRNAAPVALPRARRTQRR